MVEKIKIEISEKTIKEIFFFCCCSSVHVFIDYKKMLCVQLDKRKVFNARLEMFSYNFFLI